jgi:hypothetical protein
MRTATAPSLTPTAPKNSVRPRSSLVHVWINALNRCIGRTDSWPAWMAPRRRPNAQTPSKRPLPALPPPVVSSCPTSGLSQPGLSAHRRCGAVDQRWSLSALCGKDCDFARRSCRGSTNAPSGSSTRLLGRARLSGDPPGYADGLHGRLPSHRNWKPPLAAPTGGRSHGRPGRCICRQLRRQSNCYSRCKFTDACGSYLPEAFTACCCGRNARFGTCHRVGVLDREEPAGV